MSILLGFFPLGFALYFGWVIVRAIYRRVFRKKILEKLRLKTKVFEPQLLVQSITNSSYDSFVAAVSTSTPEEIAELVWDSPEFDRQTTKRFLDRYVYMNKNDAVANMMAGLYAIDMAWDSRGGGYASTVTEEGWRGFKAYLQQGEKNLERAIELDPSLMPAYRGLIKVQMGLSNLSKARQVFDASTKIDPHNFANHLIMLDTLTDRWLGSEKQMFKFARNMAAGHDGGNLPGLVAVAHFEHWRGLEGKEKKNYFKNENIRTDLLAVAKKMLKQKKIINAEGNKDRVKALNFLVVCLVLADRNRQAKKTFKILNDHHTQFPWGRLNRDPSVAFLEFKRYVGA